jgi:four helix bundle protein
MHSLTRMDRCEFSRRTKRFSIRVIKLVDALPRDLTSKTISHQLLRSATSVAANYRAAVRSRSRAEFIAKLGIVEEECDESLFWLELLVELDRVKPALIENLQREGDEILAITVASIKTARRNA